MNPITKTSVALAPVGASLARDKSCSRRMASLLGTAALFVFAQTTIAETATPTSVGTVTLVLGKAYLESADRPRQRVRPGTEIHVSDQIMTEANGHVHIEFDDKAHVSVRPDSLLEIVRYDWDAANPEQSSIKLNLLEGVTRAISGEGARAARERFRLNTPIAAIGVRGTDFVVSATDQSVRALVNEGAIVVAPFSSDCLAVNFGPCATNAVELTQESLQVVQMDGGTPLPRLVPAPDERGPLSREEVEVANADTSAEDKTVGTGVYLESVTSRKVTEVASNTVMPVTPTPRPPVTALPDFTPSGPNPGVAMASNQLAWGRWTGGQGGSERITAARADAAAGRSLFLANNLREGSIDIEYGLYRTQNGSEQVAKDLGVVSFALDSAQAFYHSSTGVVAMQVNSGNLNIDFNQNNFSTQLGLNHAATGVVNLAFAGRIYDDGSFHNYTDVQKMAGAVSLDGAEAGYFFEKQLGDGSVKGLTLWDKQ